MPEVSGKFAAGDMEIVFECENGVCKYTVTDTHTDQCDTLSACQPDFLVALSIAVHNDGTPNYIADYPIAENLMRAGTIRWIP